MTYQPPIQAWQTAGFSRPVPTLARRVAAHAAAWLAHGLFYFVVFTGFVVLPISLLVMLGRILAG